mmetsp:Transcript_155318/g.282441  ORF Transcript_155318/g.282441 Transcript_155318/m.282441 type:complete len:87 (+) Transcript_155318:438-698(+)
MIRVLFKCATHVHSVSGLGQIDESIISALSGQIPDRQPPIYFESATFTLSDFRTKPMCTIRKRSPTFQEHSKLLTICGNPECRLSL